MPYHELWRFVPPDNTEFIAIVEAPDFPTACKIHSCKVGGQMTRSMLGVWSYRGERVHPSKKDAQNSGREHGRQAV